MTVDADKVLVADAAYAFDYTHLPRECQVVLRYVGRTGQTPHIVSAAEIADIRRAKRVWAPIWTPTNSVFSGQLGAQAGNEMAAELKRYPMLGPEPVFLDIEQHVYAADPSGARAGVAAWQGVMHLAGHHQAYAYLPASAASQWVADWVGAAPHHFAPGVIGVQYEGSAPNRGEFDLSVFARTVFAPLLAAAVAGHTVPIGDRQYLVQQLDLVQANLARVIRGEVAKVLAPKPVPGGIDLAALADALAGRLGPGMAADLAAELARRLAT